MNEELQSTNEELEATNQQLHDRTEELNAVNNFNVAILSRMPVGMIVVDGELRVTAWNQRAFDLWGLRGEEVNGKHLLNLDIGLPVQNLRQPIRAVLSGESEMQQVILDATNRRGKTVRVAITLSPLSRPGQPPQGVILMMEDARDMP